MQSRLSFVKCREEGQGSRDFYQRRSLIEHVYLCASCKWREVFLILSPTHEGNLLMVEGKPEQILTLRDALPISNTDRPLNIPFDIKN